MPSSAGSSAPKASTSSIVTPTSTRSESRQVPSRLPDPDWLDALASDAGTALLARISAQAAEPDAPFRLGAQLRKEFPADLVAAAFTLVELRARAQSKFTPREPHVLHAPGPRASLIGDGVQAPSATLHHVRRRCRPVLRDRRRPDPAWSRARGRGRRPRPAAPAHGAPERGRLRRRRTPHDGVRGCAPRESRARRRRVHRSGAARRRCSRASEQRRK